MSFRRSNRLSCQAMSSTRTQTRLCTATPISSFVQCHIWFRLLPESVGTFVLIEIYWGSHMSVAEWVDTYGIHHRRIFWSCYRKLAWVGFLHKTTEFRSDPITDWAIRPWVQLALRANLVQLLQFHAVLSVTFELGYCLRQSRRLFYWKFC